MKERYFFCPRASLEEGDERPIDNLEIVQTLDERQADEDKLILEVKATANGLVPATRRLAGTEILPE